MSALADKLADSVIAEQKKRIEELEAALRKIEAALFEHAAAGRDSRTGEPIDDQLHPWLPGANAWPVVNLIRAALEGKSQ